MGKKRQLAGQHNRTKSNSKKRGKTFVFRMWSDDAGIFLTKETFEHLRRIQAALESSQTWGQFRAALPAGEFENLRLWWANDGEHVYQDGRTILGIAKSAMPEFRRTYGDDAEKFIIKPSDRFESGLIPGVEDAEYPPWLSCTAESQLPADFVEKYAENVAAIMAGSWTEYPSDKLDEMKSALETAGYVVEAHLSYD